MRTYFDDEVDAMRAGPRYPIAVITGRVAYLLFFGWLPFATVVMFSAPARAVLPVILTYFVIMAIAGFAGTAAQMAAGVPWPYTYPELRRVFRDDVRRLGWWSGPPPALPAGQYRPF